MQCSSPRASAGFSMLPASIAPSALPAPTMVCSSSMNRMMRPFVLRDLLEHRLQPFLELAAILGAGQQPGHVEHQHLLALQRFRHLVIDDALRQAFDDCRLADARFADQHRVVLGAPLQDLHGAADFVVATDHRVELALGGALGEVDAVLLQRFALALGLLRIDALTAAHGHDRRLQRLARQAVLLRQPPGLALVLGQGEQEHLAGDELVAALLRFLVGQVEQVGQVAADLRPRRRGPRPSAAASAPFQILASGPAH
jgi:hypothetical protein